MNLLKKPSLQETVDVIDTLKWKVQTIEEKGLPVESSLADYVDLAISNLTNELNYITDIKKQITDREKAIKAQIETIKIDGAVFMQNLGCDKLEGVICSSITVTKAREASTEENTTKVFTPLISDEEIQELLLALGKAEMQSITETETVKALPAKLRVNKRKIANAEVIEEKQNEN